MRITKLTLILGSVLLSAACMAQPDAPEGYKWEVNEKFSDEFSGRKLDKKKWHARSPYWVHGRAPATFRAYSVSVKDGMLQIKNSVLEGDSKYNIAGGAVASVARDGHYGYYECRMKASSISMSSTFWMKNKPVGDGCPEDQQELDIVEAVGMQKTGFDFRNVMKSNTHYNYWPCDGERESASSGGNCKMSPPANEAFHTYGCWWIDANTLKFYLDGEYKFTIKPPTDFSETPFDRPMYMHLVTETYNWESPPSVEELNNDEINTTYYDWVRSYKLVPDVPAESWLTKRLAESGSFILTPPAGSEYHVWGCAPIYDDEGKVHVYFSMIHEHWLKDSKIAHAVADHPEGPYDVQGIILEGRGEGFWDAHTIHNPSVYRVDGKYVMMYIGNDTTKQDNWRDRAPSANTQRVGMAIADSPWGPWERFDEPVIDVSQDSMAWDGYCTVNPSFLAHPNGEYWIYYRTWDRRNDERRKTGVAFSKNLTGPYKKYKGNPIIDFPEFGGQTEDPYIFHYKEKFHCLIRDMGNYDWHSGLYLDSKDGLKWNAFQLSHHKGSHYFPVPERSRYERVQVLFKDGEPEYLFNAIQRENGLSSGAVLKIKKEEQ